MVSKVALLGLAAAMSVLMKVSSQNYGDALTKSILFFEGQRSGKIPSTQRVTWRKDSALLDGSSIGVSPYIIILFCCSFSFLFNLLKLKFSTIY